MDAPFEVECVKLLDEFVWEGVGSSFLSLADGPDSQLCCVPSARAYPSKTCFVDVSTDRLHLKDPVLIGTKC